MARPGGARGPGWMRIALYGAALAAGAIALQWIDYLRLARTHAADLYVALVAATFLGLGIFIGSRVLRPQVRRAPGNPAAVETLGISARELAVLRELAAGRSNQEIARALHVSPNTVKTHVARLFEKLGAHRRTDAVARARELDIVP